MSKFSRKQKCVRQRLLNIKILIEILPQMVHVFLTKRHFFSRKHQHPIHCIKLVTNPATILDWYLEQNSQIVSLFLDWQHFLHNLRLKLGKLSLLWFFFWADVLLEIFVWEVTSLIWATVETELGARRSTFCQERHLFVRANEHTRPSTAPPTLAVSLYASAKSEEIRSSLTASVGFLCNSFHKILFDCLATEGLWSSLFNNFIFFAYIVLCRLRYSNVNEKGVVAYYKVLLIP